MQDLRVTPLEIDLRRNEGLRIRWSDGSETNWPLPELRKMCPCASCRHEREAASENPLRIIPSRNDESAMVMVENAELVGHYALRIAWKDGHDTGIYDYNLLRTGPQL